MDNKQNNIELRSERARNVIGQVPPIVIRLGIGAIISVALLLIIGAALLPYQPQITVTSTIKSTPQSIVGIVLIQQGRLSTDVSPLPLIVSPNSTNITINGTIHLEQRELIVTDDGAFWRIPIYFEDSKQNISAIIKGEINATTLIVLPKTTLLKWAISWLIPQRRL